MVHRHRLWIHRDDPLRSKVAIRSWPVRLLFSWKFGVGNVGFSWMMLDVYLVGLVNPNVSWMFWAVEELMSDSLLIVFRC